MSYLTGDPLLVRIRIAFGAAIAADPATWVWTDVTQWWHVDDDVSITWGRTPGADQAETSRLSLTLKNPDARFTAYDGRSPYWPNVKKWTPIQYDIDLGDGAGWRNRFSGYIRRWPLTWPGRSSRMALARIDAVGVLARLGRGKPPTRTPWRRTITSPQYPGLLAYWPCDDLVGSQQAASAIPGGPPMTVSGTVTFDADVQPPGTVTFNPGEHTGFLRSFPGVSNFISPGTSTLPSMADGLGGRLSGVVARVGTSSPVQWAVCFAARSNSLQAGKEIQLIEWETPGGTYKAFRLYHKAGGTIELFGIDANEVGWSLASWNDSVVTLTEYRIEAGTVGGGATIRLWVDGVLRSNVTFGATTLTRVQRVTANPGQAAVTGVTGFFISDIQVWDTSTPPSLAAGDINAGIADGYGKTIYPWWRHINETAHDRLARLAAQDNVKMTIPPIADAGLVTRMGAQPDGPPLNLYRESEAADQGILYETGFGLGYLPRAARYNPPVALTIDAALGQLGMPFDPVDDDQLLRNIWTVERSDGSSATAVDQDSVASQGEIEASATGLNLAGDVVLQGHADWRLHLSTVAEPSYPALTINLGTHRELATAWAACKPGSRTQVVNPPAQNVPGTIDQLIVGATETYRGRRSWRATINVVPASPWLVARVSAGARVGSVTAKLATAALVGATTVSVTDPSGAWQTGSTGGFDVSIGGERRTVTNIAGAGPQTFTFTPALAAPHPVNTPVWVWSPYVIGL